MRCAWDLLGSGDAVLEVKDHIAEDGIWGTHWYDKVNVSTGFGSVPGPLPELDGDYAEVAEQCREDYLALKRYAITAN